jgi:outer membrane protein OmpA-like peptidoglycan-associated protein
MISSDQIARLDFDRTALLGTLQLARTVKPWLELRTGLHAGAFFASGDKSAGGLLAATLGPSFSLPGRALRPYAGLDVGVGVTGLSARPYLALTLGVDGRVDQRVSVGPALSYGRLVQWNGDDYSTDASYLWVGLSLRLRFDAAPPPPPPVRVIRVERRVEHRVVEREPAPPAEPSEDMLALIESAVPTMTQRTELLAPVLFAYDSDQLEPIGVAMLHEVAHTLATRDDIRLLEIQGYADQRGSADYNQALSQRRAERVQAWLVAHGVAPERLRIAARGASEPVEPAAEERAHTQNRRVIFRVVEQGAP